MPNRTEAVAALDVGTTAVKAVVFELDSSRRTVVTREHPLLEPLPGRQVQDPQVVLETAFGALADAVAGADAEVIGLVVSTASHGLIGLDDALTPVTPVLTWADARAVAVLGDVPDPAGLHQLTGTPVHPMSPFLKLRWFAHHDPATAARVRWWLGLKDLLLFHLTGQIVTEESTASGSGLLNRWTRQWSPEAAAVAEVSLDRLPPVLPTDTVLPLTEAAAARLGLPARTPVVVGAADGPLGNLGTGALGDGVAGLSLGTSGAIRALVRHQPDVLDPALFCYALDSETWALGGAVSNGGVVMRWLGTALAPDLAVGDAPDEHLLELAAEVPPGSDGLVMLPYLLAERAPLWDPWVPGAYLGLRRSHTRAHLIRAAVEGVALQLSLIADRLHDVAPIQTVAATGGVFRSRLWAEVITGVLDRPVTVTDGTVGTARGAAALAVRALGRSGDLTGALERLPEPVDPVLLPVDPAAVAAYARARALVPRLIAALGPVADAFAR